MHFLQSWSMLTNFNIHALNIQASHWWFSNLGQVFQHFIFTGFLWLWLLRLQKPANTQVSLIRLTLEKSAIKGKKSVYVLLCLTTPSSLAIKALVLKSHCKVYFKCQKVGTNPTGAGSATTHHLEHTHFIQICSKEGVLGGCFGVELYFWLNNNRLSEARRWKWLWELAQSIWNTHRWAVAWSEHDNYGLNETETCHAQSEHVHVTHSSQLL